MDVLSFLPDHTAAIVLSALALASALLPLLETLANKTANTWDNQVLAAVRDVLAFIPRISVSPKAPGTPDAPAFAEVESPKPSAAAAVEKVK